MKSSDLINMVSASSPLTPSTPPKKEKRESCFSSYFILEVVKTSAYSLHSSPCWPLEIISALGRLLLQKTTDIQVNFNQKPGCHFLPANLDREVASAYVKELINLIELTKIRGRSIPLKYASTNANAFYFLIDIHGCMLRFLGSCCLKQNRFSCSFSELP